MHRYIIVTASEISYYLIWDTVFDSHSIREELAANSFEIVCIYGDVYGKELFAICMNAVFPSFCRNILYGCFVLARIFPFHFRKTLNKSAISALPSV